MSNPAKELRKLSEKIHEGELNQERLQEIFETSDKLIEKTKDSNAGVVDSHLVNKVTGKYKF